MEGLHFDRTGWGKDEMETGANLFKEGWEEAIAEDKKLPLTVKVEQDRRLSQPGFVFHN